MKLLDTYKAVINHQVGYTLLGSEQFAEAANLKRLQLLIFPELDKLELGKKLPKALELLSNGWLVDLSYNFKGNFYPLYLHIKDGLLYAVSKEIGNANVADAEETAYGYESFMK